VRGGRGEGWLSWRRRREQVGWKFLLKHFKYVSFVDWFSTGDAFGYLVQVFLILKFPQAVSSHSQNVPNERVYTSI